MFSCVYAWVDFLKLNILTDMLFPSQRAGFQLLLRRLLNTLLAGSASPSSVAL